MTTATPNQELVNLVFTDWRNSTEAHLEGVPRNATIGEVLGEAIRVLQLPFRSAFQAVFRDRQLNNSETLEEIGVESDARLEIMPQVSAGSEPDPGLRPGSAPRGPGAVSASRACLRARRATEESLS